MCCCCLLGLRVCAPPISSRGELVGAGRVNHIIAPTWQLHQICCVRYYLQLHMGICHASPIFFSLSVFYFTYQFIFTKEKMTKPQSAVFTDDFSARFCMNQQVG